MIIKKNDNNSIEIIANELKKNKIVILPTDTIYGFSGVVPTTKNKIFTIKGRNYTKGLISLISEPEDIFKFTDTKIPNQILKLWPAPLTLIVKEKNTDNTLAFRCPADNWLRRLIKKIGNPIYSTSVNYSSQPAMTNIEDIIFEFEDKVSLIVNDGIKIGQGSTIVSLLNGGVSILRQGELKISIM